MEEQLNNLLKQKIDKLNRVFFFVKWVSMVISISSVLLILLNMYRIVKVLIEPFRDSNALNFYLIYLVLLISLLTMSQTIWGYCYSKDTPRWLNEYEPYPLEDLLTIPTTMSVAIVDFILRKTTRMFLIRSIRLSEHNTLEVENAEYRLYEVNYDCTGKTPQQCIKFLTTKNLYDLGTEMKRIKHEKVQ